MQEDVGLGARLLVIEMAIRVLVDHACESDPSLRDWIKQSVEAHLGGLGPSSRQEVSFFDTARAFTETIVEPPVL